MKGRERKRTEEIEGKLEFMRGCLIWSVICHARDILQFIILNLPLFYLGFYWSDIAITYHIQFGKNPKIIK